MSDGNKESGAKVIRSSPSRNSHMQHNSLHTRHTKSGRTARINDNFKVAIGTTTSPMTRPNQAQVISMFEKAVDMNLDLQLSGGRSQRNTKQKVYSSKKTVTGPLGSAGRVAAGSSAQESIRSKPENLDTFMGRDAIQSTQNSAYGLKNFQLAEELRESLQTKTSIPIQDGGEALAQDIPKLNERQQREALIRRDSFTPQNMQRHLFMAALSLASQQRQRQAPGTSHMGQRIKKGKTRSVLSYTQASSATGQGRHKPISSFGRTSHQFKAHAALGICGESMARRKNRQGQMRPQSQAAGVINLRIGLGGQHQKEMLQRHLEDQRAKLKSQPGGMRDQRAVTPSVNDTSDLQSSSLAPHNAMSRQRIHLRDKKDLSQILDLGFTNERHTPNNQIIENTKQIVMLTPLYSKEASPSAAKAEDQFPNKSILQNFNLSQEHLDQFNEDPTIQAKLDKVPEITKIKRAKKQLFFEQQKGQLLAKRQKYLQDKFTQQEQMVFNQNSSIDRQQYSSLAYPESYCVTEGDANASLSFNHAKQSQDGGTVNQASNKQFESILKDQKAWERLGLVIGQPQGSGKVLNKDGTPISNPFSKELNQSTPENGVVLSVSPSFVLDQRYGSRDKVEDIGEPTVTVSNRMADLVKAEAQNADDLVNSGAPSPPRVEAMSKFNETFVESARFGHEGTFRSKQDNSSNKRNQFVLRRVSNRPAGRSGAVLDYEQGPGLAKAAAGRASRMGSSSSSHGPLQMLPAQGMTNSPVAGVSSAGLDGEIHKTNKDFFSLTHGQGTVNKNTINHARPQTQEGRRGRARKVPTGQHVISIKKLDKSLLSTHDRHVAPQNEANHFTINKMTGPISTGHARCSINQIISDSMMQSDMMGGKIAKKKYTADIRHAARLADYEDEELTVTKVVDASIVGMGPSIAENNSNFNSSCHMLVSHIGGVKAPDQRSLASTVSMIKRAGQQSHSNALENAELTRNDPASRANVDLLLSDNTYQAEHQRALISQQYAQLTDEQTRQLMIRHISVDTKDAQYQFKNQILPVSKLANIRLSRIGRRRLNQSVQHSLGENDFVVSGQCATRHENQQQFEVDQREVPTSAQSTLMMNAQQPANEDGDQRLDSLAMSKPSDIELATVRSPDFISPTAFSNPALSPPRVFTNTNQKNMIPNQKRLKTDKKKLDIRDSGVNSPKDLVVKQKTNKYLQAKKLINATVAAHKNAAKNTSKLNVRNQKIENQNQEVTMMNKAFKQVLDDQLYHKLKPISEKHEQFQNKLDKLFQSNKNSNLASQNNQAAKSLQDILSETSHDRRLQDEISAILQKAVMQDEMQRKNNVDVEEKKPQPKRHSIVASQMSCKYSKPHESAQLSTNQSIRDARKRSNDMTRQRVDDYKTSAIQSRCSQKGIIRSLQASRMSRSPNLFVLSNVREETHNNSLASQSLKGTAAVPISNENLVAYSKMKIESNRLSSRRKSVDSDNNKIKSNMVELPFSDESSDQDKADARGSHPKPWGHKGNERDVVAIDLNKHKLLKEAHSSSTQLMSQGHLPRKEKEMKQILSMQQSGTVQEESNEPKVPEMAGLVYGMSSKNVLVVNHDQPSSQEDYQLRKSQELCQMKSTHRDESPPTSAINKKRKTDPLLFRRSGKSVSRVRNSSFGGSSIGRKIIKQAELQLSPKALDVATNKPQINIKDEASVFARSVSSPNMTQGESMVKLRSTMIVAAQQEDKGQQIDEEALEQDSNSKLISQQNQGQKTDFGETSPMMQQALKDLNFSMKKADDGTKSYVTQNQDPRQFRSEKELEDVAVSPAAAGTPGGPTSEGRGNGGTDIVGEICGKPLLSPQQRSRSQKSYAIIQKKMQTVSSKKMKDLPAASQETQKTREILLMRSRSRQEYESSMAQRLTMSKKELNTYANVDIMAAAQESVRHHEQLLNEPISEARQPQIFVSYERKERSIEPNQEELISRNSARQNIFIANASNELNEDHGGGEKSISESEQDQQHILKSNFMKRAAANQSAPLQHSRNKLENSSYQDIIDPEALEQLINQQNQQMSVLRQIPRLMLESAAEAQVRQQREHLLKLAKGQRNVDQILCNQQHTATAASPMRTPRDDDHKQQLVQIEKQNRLNHLYYTQNVGVLFEPVMFRK